MFLYAARRQEPGSSRRGFRAAGHIMDGCLARIAWPLWPRGCLSQLIRNQDGRVAFGKETENAYGFSASGLFVLASDGLNGCSLLLSISSPRWKSWIPILTEESVAIDGRDATIRIKQNRHVREHKEGIHGITQVPIVSVNLRGVPFLCGEGMQWSSVECLHLVGRHADGHFAPVELLAQFLIDGVAFPLQLSK